jgi:hypothetical protein
MRKSSAAAEACGFSGVSDISTSTKVDTRKHAIGENRCRKDSGSRRQRARSLKAVDGESGADQKRKTSPIQ